MEKTVSGNLLPFLKTRLMAPSAPLGSAFSGGGLKKKKNWENFEFFFLIFPKFFSIEIILRQRRLRTQSFMILCQTVSEI